MPCLVDVDDWRASYTEQRKNRTRSYFNGRTVTAAFLLLINGTEFSYVIFTEQRNSTTVERRNGNGRTTTEWWKPGMNWFRAILHASTFRSRAESISVRQFGLNPTRFGKFVARHDWESRWMELTIRSPYRSFSSV